MDRSSLSNIFRLLIRWKMDYGGLSHSTGNPQDLKKSKSGHAIKVCHSSISRISSCQFTCRIDRTALNYNVTISPSVVWSTWSPHLVRGFWDIFSQTFRQEIIFSLHKQLPQGLRQTNSFLMELSDAISGAMVIVCQSYEKPQYWVQPEFHTTKWYQVSWLLYTTDR